MTHKNTICIWYDKDLADSDAQTKDRFYADNFAKLFQLAG
jgi:hypothetical protein